MPELMKLVMVLYINKGVIYKICHNCLLLKLSNVIANSLDSDQSQHSVSKCTVFGLPVGKYM